METIEMKDFGENYNMERAMPEETSFFERGFNEFDELNDLDKTNEYDKNIDLNNRTDLEQFDPKDWRVNNEEENTLQEKRKRWEIAQKQRITRTRKTFSRNNLNQEVVMKDGPASKELVEKCLISVSGKTGKVDGLLYDDVRVVVKKGKGFVLSTSEKSKGKVQKFSELIRKARLEHNETENGSIEDIVDSLPGTSNVNGIRANIVDRIQDEIEISDNAVDRTQLTDEELRELGGLLATNKVENLDAVDIAVEYWNDKAEEETDVRKKPVYKSISDVAKLKGDEIRLKNNLKPTGEKALEMIKNDDITKYEKFKKWAKNNLGTLTAISVSIAGIITTVVMAGKKGLTTAAKGAGKVAKKAKNAAKKAKDAAKKAGGYVAAIAAVVTPIVNFLTEMLKAGGGFLKWLADNLWVLAVALGYILYDQIKSKKE